MFTGIVEEIGHVKSVGVDCAHHGDNAYERGYDGV